MTPTGPRPPRRRPSARETEPQHDPRTTVILRASEILVDPARNARRSREPSSASKRGDGRLTDADLVADIRARGLDTPIRVRLRPDDRWELVAGARRLRACSAIDPEYRMLATVQPLEQASDLDLRLTSLAENVHRSNLRGWEVCLELWKLSRPPFSLPMPKLAELTGFSANYCCNLIRIKKQLAPELWDHWMGVGDSMPLKTLLDVCSLPEAEQAAELERQMSTATNLSHRKTRSLLLAKPLHVLRWLDSLSSSTMIEARSAEWRAGALHALQATIRRVPW
jgi:hypothetical protein